MNDLLNHKPIDNSRLQHRLYPYAKILADEILKEFPTIVKSSHTGNTYIDTMGNLKLHLANGSIIYLELKFLEAGTGTRANIGQDSLTKLGLFKCSNAMSWSAFRTEQGHQQQVLAQLNQYPRYPSGILLKVGKQQLEAKARHLRDMPKKGNRLAAAIMESIADMDRSMKIAYIRYLKTLEQNADNIKIFVFLVIAGVHTHESMTRLWNAGYQEIVEMVNNGCYVCYGYKDRTTAIKNWSNALKNLLDKRMYIWFNEEQTNVMIGFDDAGAKKTPVLRAVFHWKNIAQGIQTPCLNIFDEKYLLENL